MVGRGMLCAAPSCNNYRRTSPGLSFFRFPSEKKRCLRWIINSRRTDLEEKFLATSSRGSGGALPFSACYYSLCADHFTDCCFMNARLRNRLVHDAVPSLFTVSPHNQAHLKGLAKEEEDADAISDGAGLDADMREALEESRNMELFISKKLQELESSGHDSMNVCIPHQHHGTNTLSSDSISLDLSLAGSQQMKPIEPVQVPTTPTATARTSTRGILGNEKARSSTIGSRKFGTKSTSHRRANNNGSTGSNSNSLTPTLYYLCCSKACLSTSTNSTLFPFPSQQIQAKAWLERCGRSDLIPLLDTHGTVPNNFMLCEKHFRRNQFQLEGAEGIALVCNAMPTIFNFIAERPSPFGDVKRKFDNSEDDSSSSSRGRWGGLKVVATDRLMETCTGDPDSALQTLSSSAVSSEFCRSQGISPASSSQRQIRQWEQRQHNKQQRQEAHSGPTRCSEEDEEEQSPSKHNNNNEKISSRDQVAADDVTRSTCAYKLCKPKKRKYPLYKFPQDPSRCLAWVKNCGYENLPTMLASSVEPHISGYKLCAQHFQPNSFFKLNGQTKLLNYSVPTVFRHGPLQYPCQHKSLPERYRKCPHPNCKELIANGVYQSGIDDASSLLTLDSLRLRRRQHSPPSQRRLPYIICDKAAVEEYGTGQEESPDEAHYDDDDDRGSRLLHQESEDKKSRAIRIPYCTPMVFTDPNMTTQDKVSALDEEIDRLDKERAIYSFNLGRQRQSRFRYRRTIQALTSSFKKKDITQEDAMRFLQHRLSKSTYEFFLCQQLHRRCPPWNFDSVQIPAIANRCGLGVRETLYQIFKMPTLRTMSRYRQLIKKNPGSVPVDHILKNDLEKKYHRRLIRKYRHQLPRSISSVINEYIGKRDDDAGPQGDLPHGSSTDDELAAEGGRTRKSSYHHKKYNSPQKWKNYEEQE